MELHTVVEWAGHADSTMILKIYDEVSDTRSKKEADRLIQEAFGITQPEQKENIIDLQEAQQQMRIPEQRMMKENGGSYAS